MKWILSLCLSLCLASAAFAQEPEPEGPPPGEGAEPAGAPLLNGVIPSSDPGLPPPKKAGYDNNDLNFRDVAQELRCPTCTGLSVLESDASFSVQIKDQVQEQLNLGKDKDQILQFFVDRYGPWILREPPVKGFGVLAWAIPIGLLIVGPFVIWLVVWKRRRVFNTHGVRSAEAIIEEMQERLSQMKKGKA